MALQLFSILITGKHTPSLMCRSMGNTSKHWLYLMASTALFPEG